MAVSPRVSIVIPLFNDQDHVDAALQSCLAQTTSEIEIICVDDASTDQTVDFVERHVRRDERVRLIRQPANLSAFQARRVGVAAASAPYIMFLDGDDELSPAAVETVLAKAKSTRADVVGFGVEIVVPEGNVPKRFEAALQPSHAEVHAPYIVSELFPAGQEANGHLWRYLWATSLLRAAYEGVPAALAFYRANDLPITFLALAHAQKYVSTPERLYRYYFRRGTSGHGIDGVDQFKFLLTGVEPIAAISAQVHAAAQRSGAPREIIDSYESARLHIIGNVLSYCLRDTSGELQTTCIRLLKEKVGDLDVVRAAAAFVSDAMPTLSAHTKEPSQATRHAQSILLTTAHLETGGLQGVLLEHAAQLVAAGYRVTIAVMREASRDVSLPDGVDLVRLTGDSRLARVDRWLEICQQYEIDLIIDHHILYNDNWPWFVLAALGAGVPTIGWVHNFALRPVFDGTQRASFLAKHMRLLLTVVTLSPTDVAFWKLRGLQRVVYLPNPPSPLALSALDAGYSRTHEAGRLELAWWGRLDARTKQVQHLVEIAALLRARGVDFHLRIIGPDSRDLSAGEVRRNAVARGVGDAVELLGERHGEELLAALADTHILVLTSAIEGSPLVITEAQSLGLPVVMYDLPWVTGARGDAGLVVTAPGDRVALADAIARIADDSRTYAMLSAAARESAQAASNTDIGSLLVALLTGNLPAGFSPEPTIDDARLLVEWLLRFSERFVRVSSRGRPSAAELAAVRRERDRAQRKLKEVTAGPSFRIGRAITLLPRKLRTFRSRERRSGSETARIPFGGTLATSAQARESTSPPVLSDSPDVTFVIPIYNSEQWLESCITSVLSQTGVNTEVICVNDGSTDGSATILDRIAAADPRVKVLDQPNAGQSVARNRGLDAATGRYIIYLDSDDYWTEDALEQLVRRADEDHLDMLLFDCVAFRDGDVDDKTWDWYSRYYTRSRVYSDVSSGADLMATMRRNGDYRPHVGLYLARTSFVREIGLRFVPGIVHQDNPYTFRLLLHAARAAHVGSSFYARRIRPGSTITTLTPEKSALGYFLGYVEMSRELADQELPAGSREPINNIVEYVFRGAAKQFALISEAAAAQIGTADTSDDAQFVFASLKAAAEIPSSEHPPGDTLPNETMPPEASAAPEKQWTGQLRERGTPVTTAEAARSSDESASPRRTWQARGYSIGALAGAEIAEYGGKRSRLEARRHKAELSATPLVVGLDQWDGSVSARRLRILDGELSVECFGTPSPTARLHIFLSAGGGALKDGVTPEFPRASWHPWLDGVCVNIDDPTFGAFPGKLQTGWYLGTPSQDAVASVVAVIETIRAHYGIAAEDVFVVGSSAGGTAALKIARALPGAVAIAENPPIYPHERSSKKYFVRAGLDIERGVLRERNNLDHILVDSASRYVVIQNAEDTSVVGELRNFLHRAGLPLPGIGLSQTGPLSVYFTSVPSSSPHHSFLSVMEFCSVLAVAPRNVTSTARAAVLDAVHEGLRYRTLATERASNLHVWIRLFSEVDIPELADLPLPTSEGVMRLPLRDRESVTYRLRIGGRGRHLFMAVDVRPSASHATPQQIRAAALAADAHVSEGSGGPTLSISRVPLREAARRLTRLVAASAPLFE